MSESLPRMEILSSGFRVVHPPVEPENDAPIVRPAADQPGSLLEQFAIIALTRSDPDTDRRRAMQRAREAVLPHARRQA